VVSDYWVDHREYIPLIDLRIVLLRIVFRSVIVLYCKFSNCFHRNSRRFHRSGREVEYRDRDPSPDFPSLEWLSRLFPRSNRDLIRVRALHVFPSRSDRYKHPRISSATSDLRLRKQGGSIPHAYARRLSAPGRPRASLLSALAIEDSGRCLAIADPVRLASDRDLARLAKRADPSAQEWVLVHASSCSLGCVWSNRCALGRPQTVSVVERALVPCLCRLLLPIATSNNIRWNQTTIVSCLFLVRIRCVSKEAKEWN
jgi:hypothetical protein